jgi:hypothetical protein
MLIHTNCIEIQSGNLHFHALLEWCGWTPLHPGMPSQLLGKREVLNGVVLDKRGLQCL